MKKICVLMALMMMLASIAGCGNNKASETASSVTNSEQKGDSNTLTISVNKSNRFLEMAAKEFEKKNNGINVKIKQYVTPGNKGDIEKLREKYISNISTELMSGQGSDIIGISWLPYKELINKKMLADINELIEGDKEFKVNDYYTNIFDALKYKGHLNIIPLCVDLQLIGSNIDLTKSIDDKNWKWKDFFDAAEGKSGKGSKDGGYLLMENEQSVFDYMYQSKYDYFVNEENKKSNFLSGEFVNMMNYSKELSGKNLIIKNSEKNPAENSQFNIYDFVSVSYLVNEVNAGNMKYFYRMPSDDSKRGIQFNSNSILAMNNNSKNKKLAWEFIKFLISPEIQSSEELLGFPINVKGLDIKLNREAKEDKSGAFEKYSKFTKEIIKAINKFNSCDPRIIKTITNESSAFFDGQKTAQQTAEIIQNKVSTFLAE